MGRGREAEPRSKCVPRQSLGTRGLCYYLYQKESSPCCVPGKRHYGAGWSLRPWSCWGAALLLPVAAAGQDWCGKSTELITTGQRVFTCGHSFHVWVPAIVADLCNKANIPDHKQIGVSSIGGSRVIQHWNIAEEKNTAKKALESGKVDVLTLSPIFLPDPGIGDFARLALQALQGHPDSRPAHLAACGHLRAHDEAAQDRGSQRDHRRGAAETACGVFQGNGRAHSRAEQEGGQDGAVRGAGRGRPIIRAREKIIAGKAPGLKSQEDLFSDELGHGKPALMALVGYCNLAIRN